MPWEQRRWSRQSSMKARTGGAAWLSGGLWRSIRRSGGCWWSICGSSDPRSCPTSSPSGWAYASRRSQRGSTVTRCRPRQSVVRLARGMGRPVRELMTAAGFAPGDDPLLDTTDAWVYVLDEAQRALGVDAEGMAELEAGRDTPGSDALGWPM